MSVLSSPQGTPERVWSVIAGLQALGGEADRPTFNALLNPGYIKEGGEVRAKDLLANEAPSAASSLGLIDLGRDKVTMAPGLTVQDYVAFADHIHDSLIALAPDHIDGVLLETYAWVAAECDRQNDLGWIYDWGREDFANRAKRAVRGEEGAGGGVNPSNITAWRRWLNFLGLGISLPLTSVPDFPVPTLRLARELERADVATGTVQTAEEFLTLIARRMPYLDRGRLFLLACQRIGHQPAARQLSPLLSAALRDLHDGGSLSLKISGDASTHVRLTPDPAHAVQAFTSVLLGEGSVA